MLREVVKIDEDLCNGCGDCVPACHEGALQVIDGKVKLISDLMCDGLGACIGHCPQGAITIEKREAEPYNETKVMDTMISKGKNTIVAHLKHLRDHNEKEYLRKGIKYLKDNQHKLDFKLQEVVAEVNGGNNGHSMHQGGCPGSRAMSIKRDGLNVADERPVSGRSELGHWPVQMHLINPAASYFKSADIIIAADCVAYALGNFHQKYLKGKSLAIACPKLDEGPEIYIEKIRKLIDDSLVNTINVMIMQVPCCSGLLQMIETASARAQRKVPVKCTVVGIKGEILSEEWVN
jgi:ferredoxin